jgi:hypothetical protein
VTRENENEGRDSFPEGWHLKKEVSIGQIIAILSVAASLMIGWFQMDKRISLLEVESISAKERDGKIETMVHDSVTRIEQVLYRIEDRLNEVHDQHNKKESRQ